MTVHRVTAILVVHDGATWLPEVVAAVTSQKRKVDAIIAVDTGSEDTSVKLLKGARIPVLTMDRETGFGDAVAQAVSTLPEIDTDSDEEEWLWIVHDDLAPHNKALRTMLEAVTDRPNVVMAGPKLLGWHDHHHLLEVGISIAGNGARWTGLEDNEYDQGQHDGVKDVLSVSTAGALIRRDVFEDLGGFDPNLELFRDDVDFGWRVRTAGHSVIAVTDAIAFHAEASASERRSVDVHGAFLHRPRLLDRRNAAYVLLANSSWWTLPLLTLQILSGAVLRSLGYLFAKLPGYASDEILAIGSLFLKPNELIQARRFRKKTRLVSPRIIREFIPSRSSQLRISAARLINWFRKQFLPEVITEDFKSTPSPNILDDEDLLTPAGTSFWRVAIKRPLFLAFITLFLLSIVWARYRFGSISGGTLPKQLSGASDLWAQYFSGWHNVAMGSAQASPSWVPIIALASILTLGNVPLFFTFFFLIAPILLMTSAYSLLKTLTEKRWLATTGSAVYAISPVSVSAINTGRVGTLAALLLVPIALKQLSNWHRIENLSWRSINGLGLLSALIFAFSPMIFLSTLLLILFAIVVDFFESDRDYKSALFIKRSQRRGALALIPLFLNLPWSLGVLANPHRFFLEPGFMLPGGGPNYAIFGNPGGAGAIPWWLFSPILIIIVIALFSVTRAKYVAEYAFGFLLCATLLSAVGVSSNANSTAERLYVGPLLAVATILAVAAATIMLDQVRESLASSHLNYRHFASAFLILSVGLYSILTVAWIATEGATSPTRAGQKEVLPAFLAVESDAKSMVLRDKLSGDEAALTFYIARGGDVTLGQPDIAPSESKEISKAVREISDGSGLNSGQVLAQNGIKYLFFAKPIDKAVVRTIDGLGGFTRASSTSAGIVWKVTNPTGELVFMDADGVRTVLEKSKVTGEYLLPGPGTLTLSETFNRGWQISQEGKRLPRSVSADNLPVFSVANEGPATLLFDGTARRGWLSLQLIFFVTVLTLALPGGRRRREISEEELA
jgi:GT2 family glycosyltransferase